MSNLVTLLKQLPSISQSRMISSGYAVWFVWDGDLNNAVPHTLKDYGCIRMVEDKNQALWYSHSIEVFRALSRLQIWSRLNSMPLFCQVIPVTFLVGYNLDISLSVPAEFGRQSVDAPEQFEVWVHPKAHEAIKRVPGLELVQKASLQGVANINWMLLAVDQSLDYETIQRWYYAIKPLGKIREKNSLLNWRAYFEELKPLFTRLGLRFLSSIKDEAVFLPLNDFTSLRTFCTEILNAIQTIKEDPALKEWPCVMAAIPQGDLPFNDDLSQRFNLDWNRLTPDLPHLQYRDAFMLGEWFMIEDVRYGGGQESLESWCTINLKDKLEDGGRLTMDVSLPPVLFQGDESPCFYCGQKSHPTSECPTRQMEKPDFSIWKKLSRFGLKDLSAGLSAIESILSQAPDPVAASTELCSGDKVENVIMQSIYEINVPAQLRLLQTVWRSRGKEWPDGLKNLVPAEGQFVWEALEALRRDNHESAASLLLKAKMKFARSYIPPSLHGFVEMELGEERQAEFHWQEAERLSYTPLQQGYVLYLQARLLEVLEEYRDAAQLYNRVQQISPRWLDPAYRSGVCMVKMGFTGQAIDVLCELIRKSPQMFNRIVIDPELERSRSQVLSALWRMWAEAETVFQKEKERIEELSVEIAKRFSEDHDFYQPAKTQLERMSKMAEKENYVAFVEIVRMIADFEKKLEAQVEKDIKKTRSKVEVLREKLQDIQLEAAWFPFPKLLKEFNRDFNYCVDKMNWINNQHLKGADTFRQSQKFLEEIESRLKKLQSRLVSLRIVRDTTLFALLLGRSFIWFELMGLGLALLGLPALVYFTRSSDGGWIVDILRDRQWEVQKGLILILSVLALVIASIKSAVSFDRKKRELFEKTEKGLASRRKAKAVKREPASGSRK